MSRFYLLIIVVLAAARAHAQTPAPATPSQDRTPVLEYTFDAQRLRELPLADTPLAVPETITTEAVADRFSAGGLNSATPARIGAFLNSWTQTDLRIGDISIADPRAGGTPMLSPNLSFWRQLTIATGAMRSDDRAPALAVTVDPLRPGNRWTRTFEGRGTAPAMVAGVSGLVPPVDLIGRAGDVAFAASGPATDRVGVVAAGSWHGVSHTDARAGMSSDRIGSAFAHVVAAAGPRDEVRALVWAQQASTAAADETRIHAQATWARAADARRWGWRLFGGFTGRSRSVLLGANRVFDSLADDPVAEQLDSESGTARRWTVGARVGPEGGASSIGVDVGGASIEVNNSIASIRELVDGVLARTWSITGGGDDRRHATTVSAFGSRRWTIDRLSLDAGVRVESVSARADAATQGISWTAVLPRAAVRYVVEPRTRLDAVASYRRSAYQLPLNLLAIGDPAAPVADVATFSRVRVARVGPGTGGDPSFTQLDPALEQPITDELVLALQWRPRPALRIELARVTKREDSLLTLTNTGIPASSYTALLVDDPSFIPSSPVGASQVTVFNRPLEQYGRDRYLLTNRRGEAARSWALELNVRAETERAMVLVGAALTEAYGPAAAVGFLPTQNDQDVLGSLLADRNAETMARGQLFQDRSHVVKMAAVYRFPRRVTAGAILRYLDGQPFSRVVVVPLLTQGPTAVRSYANGGSAFSYVATLDVRLQKTFVSGRSEVAAILDAYNVTDLGNEVSERIVTGAAFRAPAALQPPRTIVAGLRLLF